MLPITLQAEGGGTLEHPNVSPAGARGPMQVMPGTATDPGYGVRPMQDGTEAERARVGRDYLGAMMRRYGDPAQAWAAYNGGPGRMDRARQHGVDWLRHMPGETREYVQRNMRALRGR
jgi:soluble lytic murein transglycosylase